MLDKMPKEYTYRKETEKLVKDRLKIVKEVMLGLVQRNNNLSIYYVSFLIKHILQNIDVQAIEKKIGCGQVEELIIQAKNEMSLSEKILVWKPWEKLIQEAPPNQWTWPPHK